MEGEHHEHRLAGTWNSPLTSPEHRHTHTRQQAFQANYGSGNVSLGTLDQADVTVQGRSNTTLTLPVNVTYSANNDPSFTFLQSLVTACRDQRPIPLSVDITLAFSILAWTGYNPRFRLAPALDCPLPQGLVTQLAQAASLV